MPADVTFTRFFADLPDPRANRTRRHRLEDIRTKRLNAALDPKYLERVLQGFRAD